MSQTIDLVTGIAQHPMRARSLFLWHQILGRACGASAHLREMAGVIIGLSLGADIAWQTVKIRPVADGFDIQENALPNADALFAYVSEPGLQLVTFSEPTDDGRTLRRLQVLDQHNKPYRRRGSERFLLRYRLDQAILTAQDVVLLSIVNEPGVEDGPLQPGARRAARLPPLVTWIEIARGEARNYISVAETSAAVLADNEVARLSAFAAGALPAEAAKGGITALYLYFELTGEMPHLDLLGESLLV